MGAAYVISLFFFCVTQYSASAGNILLWDERHADRYPPRLDAFIRDELSKGRYDPAISKVCFEMLLELFGRTLKVDLGEHDGKKMEVEDVC